MGVPLHPPHFGQEGTFPILALGTRPIMAEQERPWSKAGGKEMWEEGFSPCSTALLPTPLIFHFFSLALATHSGSLEWSWHRGVPWGPPDPWIPFPPSSLLTSSPASPATEGFLCPAPLQLKDLHFKGVLEWICTDIYLQV